MVIKVWHFRIQSMLSMQFVSTMMSVRRDQTPVLKLGCVWYEIFQDKFSDTPSKAHSLCVNYDGFYNCRCERGYEGSPCSDVDECLQPLLTVCDPQRHKVIHNKYCIEIEPFSVVMHPVVIFAIVATEPRILLFALISTSAWVGLTTAILKPFAKTCEMVENSLVAVNLDSRLVLAVLFHSPKLGWWSDTMQ